MISFRALLLRFQLRLAKPIVRFTGIEASRLAQDNIGKLGARALSGRVKFEDVTFPEFSACFAVPSDAPKADPRVILYLHGGGYVAGTLDYAKGFGGVLSAATGLKALCVAYRLAPENKFPAALDDAETAYRYLLDAGYLPENIAFVGESAGGGLCYCLSLKLKAEGLPLPKCIIGISPWVDLTLAGQSYQNNVWRDPSLIRESLAYYVLVYAAGKEDEAYVSPLRGELKGLPPSLLFVGGDEILYSDVCAMHEKLLSSGCDSALVVEPGMWHVYPLYGTPEGKRAIRNMVTFLHERLGQAPEGDGPP